MKSIIWTGTTRRHLYCELVRQFGAYKTWQKRHSPGKGRDREFDHFCEAFADTIGASSADAVKHQIAFALPISENGGARWNGGGLAQNAILNIAAAYEVGFITSADFPTLVAANRNGKKTTIAAAPVASVVIS